MVINKILIGSFAKATERAAYGASIFKGKNDKIAVDQAALDEMRKELNKIDMKGKIVIGEGELDEAPMLYINEKVGTQTGESFDIAVDPLEGTNFTAKNLPNALSVLAVARSGNLLHAPDIYMEKIAIGPNLPKNIVDLDFTVRKNIELLSKSKNIKPSELTVCVLKRPRHDSIVKTLSEMNVKINFITDGDVSGAISVADTKTGIDIYMECTGLDLLKDEDRISGMVAMWRDSGEFIIFHCKAIILATGGGGKAWKITSNSWEYTGDGYGMATAKKTNLCMIIFLIVFPLKPQIQKRRQRVGFLVIKMPEGPQSS